MIRTNGEFIHSSATYREIVASQILCSLISGEELSKDSLDLKINLAIKLTDQLISQICK